MPRDAVIGGMILAFAGLYWLAAGTIRHSSLDDPIGAAGLPSTLATVLAGLAVLLIVRSLIMARPAVPREDESEAPTAHLRALGMLALGVLYLVLVPSLGYALAVALLLGTVALYNHQRLTPGLGLFAVLGAAGFYVLFVRVLNIPLPPGIWPKFLPV